jgi:hypothetical protein
LICVAPVAIGADLRRDIPERPAALALADWPQDVRLAAAKLIEEFGSPDRREPDRLVWHKRKPWEEITVWNTASPSGRPSANAIEESVACRVPLEMILPLTAFSRTIRASRDGALLAARSPSEELNYLKLNLSHEIIAGKMSPSQARTAYERTLRLAAAGKDSPLLRGLLFLPPARRSPGPQALITGPSRASGAPEP